MNTCAQALLFERALRKLRTGLRPLSIPGFPRAYVESVICRPLLTAGMLLSRGGADVAQSKWLILIDADQDAHERAVTLWHELIHIQLIVLGIGPEYHDEDAIDACARELTYTYPDIGRQVQQVFSAPDLAPNSCPGVYMNRTSGGSLRWKLPTIRRKRFCTAQELRSS